MRPRPLPSRLPACPVRDVPHHRLPAGRSLPCLCGRSHTQTPRSCPLRPAHRRVGNTAPTEKEEDREPRGVRFCQVRLEAPTRSPEPRGHALRKTHGVSHPRARGKARPTLRSSAHPARGPPHALAALGLTFGALSPLAGCCGFGAAGRRTRGRGKGQ